MKQITLEKKWQDYLVDEPESDGYCVVGVRFKDGTILHGLKIFKKSELHVPFPYTTPIEELYKEGSGMEKKAIRMRIKPPRRRTPRERLKARLYYRRNRARILLQRRRYRRKYKSVLKRRRMFQRFKPSWLRKRKHPKFRRRHR